MSVTARPGTPVGQVPSAPLPLVVAGAVGGAAAAALSFGVFAVIALAAWMLDPGGPQEWAQMLEAASAAWLSGLGVSPTIGGIAVTLLPLGFAVVLIVALVGAARWATEASAVARRGEALAVALSAAVGFGVVAAIVGALSRSLDVAPVTAALSGAAMALVVTGLTVLRRTRLISLDRVPGEVRAVAAGAAAAVLALVSMAGIALIVAVITQVDGVTALLVALDAGPSGVLLLTVLSLGYLPTALMWVIAYLLGAGVQVAAGVEVSPYADAASASLPGFPLLAAIPGVVPSWTVILPVVGIAAGMAAGAVVRRRGHFGLRTGAPLGAAAGIAAGAFLGILSWLASGSVGGVALVGLGPAPLQVALIGATLMAVGALTIASWPARHRDG